MHIDVKNCILYMFIFLVLISCGTPEMSFEQQSLYIQARKSYIQGDFEKAVSTLETGHFSVKKGHQGLLLSAKSYFMLLEPEKAESVLLRLTEAYPGYTEAQIWLVRTLLAREKFVEAGVCLEKALEFNSEDPRLLQLYASLHESRGEYQKAFEYYTRVSFFADEIGKTEINLAQLYFRFSQTEKAKYHIDRAISMISPDNLISRPLAELRTRIEKELEK